MAENKYRPPWAPIFSRQMIKLDWSISSTAAEGSGELVGTLPTRSLVYRAICIVDAVSLGTNAVLSVAVGTALNANTTLASTELDLVTTQTPSGAAFYGDALTEEGSVLSTAGAYGWYAAAQAIYFNWVNASITAGTTTASGDVYIIYDRLLE